MDNEKKQERYKAQTAWKRENRDRINLEIPRGGKDRIKAVLCGKSQNEYIWEAILDKIENTACGKYDFCESIPDLEVYAKSIGLTPEEYVKIAVAEKMERQDQEYQEEITREKLDY